MIILKYGTIMLNDSLFHCSNSSQYLRKLFKSVSVRKSNLKFCTVTSTKNSHYIPKNQISVAAATLKYVIVCSYSMRIKHFMIFQANHKCCRKLHFLRYSLVLRALFFLSLLRFSFFYYFSF